MNYDKLALEACQDTCVRIGFLRDALLQDQPGMPALPYQWREYFLRWLHAAEVKPLAVSAMNLASVPPQAADK